MVGCVDCFSVFAKGVVALTPVVAATIGEHGQGALTSVRGWGYKTAGDDGIPERRQIHPK